MESIKEIIKENLKLLEQRKDADDCKEALISISRRVDSAKGKNLCYIIGIINELQALQNKIDSVIRSTEFREISSFVNLRNFNSLTMRISKDFQESSELSKKDSPFDKSDDTATEGRQKYQSKLMTRNTDSRLWAFL